MIAVADLIKARTLPVHVAQEVTFRRPVRVGDCLRSTAAVTSVSPGPAGVVAVIRMRTDDAASGRVCDSAATVYLPGVGMALFGESPRGASAVITEVRAPAGEMASVEYVIDREQARRYAEASGDHNPIHLDDEAARAAGFGRPIVHGMCVLALVCRAAVDELGEGDPTRVRHLGARFGKPVHPGDRLRIMLGPPAVGSDGYRHHRLRAETDQGLVLKRGAIELAV